jgi:VIT1/CCC1 family predicted Fe2+/Mn2+ transporter
MSNKKIKEVSTKEVSTKEVSTKEVSTKEVSTKEVSTKENLTDWLVYSIIAAILLLPFFAGEYFKYLSASLIVGFLFGMINRIIRELVLLRKQLKDYEEENN